MSLLLAFPLFGHWALAQQTTSGGQPTTTTTPAATQTPGGNNNGNSTNGNGQTYKLADNFVGDKFFDGWDWFIEDDPTKGRVNYIDMQSAKSKNLSYGTSLSCFLRLHTSL